VEVVAVLAHVHGQVRLVLLINEASLPFGVYLHVGAVNEVKHGIHMLWHIVLAVQLEVKSVNKLLVHYSKTLLVYVDSEKT
jgi:hypothetical protein